MMYEVPRSRWHFIPLATRGERLALGHVVWHGDVDGSGGAADAEYVEVFEVDADGRSVASVLFDPADLDAAYAELDARFAAGEGAAQTRLLAVLRAAAQTYQSHVGDKFADSYHPDVVVHDHRVLGWGTVHGLADFTRMQRSLV